ncbi:hypothetical protein CkaCkLH20_09234 [Colletotrichum karsti]|uniref:Uncharacterized protein n=1 Tax=Colletotrichum karsti TaxID=1095194 RepID=A0A9P6LHQ7_9PEZI|nr:uncharacterized protein CkaCkLH20_09234 [Colletotrichum karsti]KAF9873421.1 hypothetical protein CkaCkLH20_09234 [Colletotrichum karsti]
MFSPAKLTANAFNSFRWSIWGPQYAALLGAAAALMAMVILLAKFDDQLFFEWKGISLNTIISILSVTIKAAVTFVISECISQWKWILFSRGEQRLLIDFDRIDAAARGPLGSLRILFRTKRAFVTQFGAVLTLIVLGLDPFTQQLIQLRPEIQYNEPDDNAVAYIANTGSYYLGTAQSQPRFFENSTFNSEGNVIEFERHEWWNVTTSVSPSMEGAIMSAFYNSTEQLRNETLFECTAGECKFGPFQTLGICHRCNDVTSELTTRADNFDNVINAIYEYRTEAITSNILAKAVSLPNGHFIANTDGCRPYNDDTTFGCWGKSTMSTTFGTGNPNKTVSMKDIDTLLWSMSFIYPNKETLNKSGSFPSLKDGGNKDAVTWPTVALNASECALYYCVKNISSTVLDNRLEEDITEVDGVTRTEDSWDSGLTDQTGLTHQTRVRPPEYLAPPDESRALEFHEYWSVAFYKNLTLTLPSLRFPWRMEVGQESVKSLSAHFQGLFRWEPWYNNTKIREALQKIPGMEKADGFNGAILGPLDQTDLNMDARPPALKYLLPWSRLDHANISVVFETLAMSMTNEMRRTSDMQDQARNGMDTMSHKGLVGSPIVLYRVAWPWIALHVTALACALVFLFMTIHGSDGKENIPLWKSSSLAAIRRGHDAGGVFDDTGPSIGEMENKARKVYMGESQDDPEEAKPCITLVETPVPKQRSQSHTF